ncbi:MAG: DUF2059 domain-containing protein [Planctomycetota bacterium]|nr:DUF2059 domain-containing protein [Planctomycetota bacterium]
MNRTACFFAGVALATFAPHILTGVTSEPVLSAESSVDDKADETAKRRKKVEELLESMDQKAITTRTLEVSMESFTEMGLPEDFQTCFKENFSIDRVMEFTTDIYTEHLEESTVDALLAFYKSDEGKAFVKVLPEITIDGLKKGTEYGKQVGMDCAQGR